MSMLFFLLGKTKPRLGEQVSPFFFGGSGTFLQKSQSTMTNLVRYFVSGIACFFGRFLGSEGTAILPTSPVVVLAIFVILFILIIIYRIRRSKGKKSPFLFVLILFLISIFCALLRNFICSEIFSFVGVLSTFFLKVDSGTCNMTAPPGNSGDGDGSGGPIYLETVLPRPAETRLALPKRA